MRRFVTDLDAAKRKVQEMPAELVMIAGNVDNARSLARLAEDFLDDVVVRLWPVPSATKLPAIDDVADQIKVFGLGVAKKIEQVARLTASRAQMQIGDPDRPEAKLPITLFIDRVRGSGSAHAGRSANAGTCSLRWVPRRSSIRRRTTRLLSWRRKAFHVDRAEH